MLTIKATDSTNRKLATPMGNLKISVPRTKNGNFCPNILPEPYKRIDKSYTELLLSLVVNGYSEILLLNALKSLNLPYSEEEINKINKIKNDLTKELDIFKTKGITTRRI